MSTPPPGARRPGDRIIRGSGFHARAHPRPNAAHSAPSATAGRDPGRELCCAHPGRHPAVDAARGQCGRPGHAPPRRLVYRDLGRLRDWAGRRRYRHLLESGRPGRHPDPHSLGRVGHYDWHYSCGSLLGAASASISGSSSVRHWAPSASPAWKASSAGSPSSPSSPSWAGRLSSRSVWRVIIPRQLRSGTGSFMPCRPSTTLALISSASIAV